MLESRDTSILKTFKYKPFQQARKQQLMVAKQDSLLLQTHEYDLESLYY